MTNLARHDLLIGLILFAVLALPFVLLVEAGHLKSTTFKDAIVPLGALTVAVFTLRWAHRQWRLKFLTEEWTKLLQFLMKYPQYMDADSNKRYREVYSSPQMRMEYEMVARLCLSYLDDLYYLGYGEEMGSWVHGSIHFFGGTHWAWFVDHEVSYNPEFREYLRSCVSDACTHQGPPSQ
jgi:hypothetical protein